MRGLAKRGMPVPETSATEGARGLTTAIEAMWPKSFRIRCGFPTMQNLPQKVPAQLCSEVNALLVDRRDAPTPAKAEKRREAIVEQSPREWPEACRCLLDEAQASLNHLLVPQRHQRYGRPSDLVARAFVEERCRTKVIPHLWGEPSLVNLVFGGLIRVSDRWGKKCFRELAQQQVRHLRRKLHLDDQDGRTPPLSEPLSRRSAASAAYPLYRNRWP